MVVVRQLRIVISLYSGVPAIWPILLFVRCALSRWKYTTPLAAQAASTPSRSLTTFIACAGASGARRKTASLWKGFGSVPTRPGATS